MEGRPSPNHTQTCFCDSRGSSRLLKADGVDDDTVVIVVPNDHEVTVELSAFIDHAGSEGRAFAGGISPKHTAKESAPHFELSSY